MGDGLAESVPVGLNKRMTPKTTFDVEYFATARSPKGSESRFTATGNLSQIRGGGASETAVLAYLQQRHPCCDIQIINLEFH